jgi:hypothetical protein
MGTAGGSSGDHLFEPSDWANESHALAQSTAYGKLPQPKNGTYLLDDDYFAEAMPVADVQLQRAGIRLARLLNETLGGTKKVATTASK